MRAKPDVKTWQTRWEHEQLVALYDRLSPQRVLEVGVYDGGTLWHWLKPSVHVVAVDNGADLAPTPDRWGEWAREAEATLYFLYGSSQDSGIVSQVAALAPFDFVLIDGDHSYEAVRQDWDNYRPMVEVGGVIVLHDVAPDPNPAQGVQRLWAEIKGELGTRTMEFIDMSEGCRGVGAVFV